MNVNTRHFLRSFWISHLWAFFILIVCLLPKSTVEQAPKFEIPGFDKMVHFGLYFIWGFLFLRNFVRYNKSRNVSNFRIYLISISVSLILGGLIEIVQQYTPIQRTGDWFDLLADALGCVCAVFVHEKKLFQNLKILEKL